MLSHSEIEPHVDWDFPGSPEFPQADTAHKHTRYVVLANRTCGHMQLLTVIQHYLPPLTDTIRGQIMDVLQQIDERASQLPCNECMPSRQRDQP